MCALGLEQFITRMEVNMATPGRKPKPTQMHILNGNPSKLRLEERISNEVKMKEYKIGDKSFVFQMTKYKKVYSDKTSPEVIKDKFGISKAAFKRALDHLLKEESFLQLILMLQVQEEKIYYYHQKNYKLYLEFVAI